MGRGLTLTLSCDHSPAQSGLSMTDWRPQGKLPPITEDEWKAEFEIYKVRGTNRFPVFPLPPSYGVASSVSLSPTPWQTFPEWQQRKNMTVDEFKFIYWWEYGHRQLGRVAGVAFTLPLMYFWARGRIPSHLKGRMLGLFGLGGAQGLVGWWMVKSGLEMDPNQKKARGPA